MEEKQREWETLKEKFKKLVLYWWRREACLNCDFYVLQLEGKGKNECRQKAKVLQVSC